MARWLIRTFTTDTGGKPVDDWIRSLSPVARAEVVLTVDLLKEHGTALTMPFARYLDRGIWELRARGPDGIYRVIYFHWKGRTLGLLHGFVKKTQTTPKKELELAMRRRDVWLSRASARRRKGNG